MSTDAHCFRVGAARLSDAAREVDELADTLERLADCLGEGAVTSATLKETTGARVAALRNLAAGHRLSAGCLVRHANASDAEYIPPGRPPP